MSGDGPSRSTTPPITGEHSAAIAAAVAQAEAVKAAGQEPGVRFQLPPHPPHHTPSSGSLGSAGGQQQQQQSNGQQQEQQRQHADDLAARLAVLHSR